MSIAEFFVFFIRPIFYLAVLDILVDNNSFKVSTRKIMPL